MAEIVKDINSYDDDLLSIKLRNVCPSYTDALLSYQPAPPYRCMNQMQAVSNVKLGIP